eukprot:6175560-Pleurochrysis_carterae.AAC.1
MFSFGEGETMLEPWKVPRMPPSDDHIHGRPQPSVGMQRWDTCKKGLSEAINCTAFNMRIQHWTYDAVQHVDAEGWYLHYMGIWAAYCER